jgi:hypothetical protein
MFLVPEAFDATETYPQGSIVSYSNTIYFAAQAVPANTTPGAPNEAYWTVYFGPLTVTPYDSTISYYAGELVYDVVGTTVSIYQCLTTGTEADPTAAPDDWDSRHNLQHRRHRHLQLAVWQSKIDLNTANTPAAGANWQSVPATQGATQVGQDWLQIDASVRYQRFQYPIGAGPSSQTTAQHLPPAVWLSARRPRKTPRPGGQLSRSARRACPQDDWEHEGNFITTSDSRSSSCASWPTSRTSPSWTRCSARAWREDRAGDLRAADPVGQQALDHQPDLQDVHGGGPGDQRNRARPGRAAAGRLSAAGCSRWEPLASPDLVPRGRMVALRCRAASTFPITGRG